MLDDVNVKNLRDSLRCKYQLKQITKIREKNVATNENCILIKIGLKFQNSSFNILYELAFWTKPKWQNKDCSGKKVTCLVEQP